MSTTITLTLRLDAAAAVRGGGGRAGPVKMAVGPAELAQLTDRQRDALARHVDGEEGWSRPLTLGGPPIGAADVTSLALLLDARADAMEGGNR